MGLFLIAFYSQWDVGPMVEFDWPVKKHSKLQP